MRREICFSSIAGGNLGDRRLSGAISATRGPLSVSATIHRPDAVSPSSLPPLSPVLIFRHSSSPVNFRSNGVDGPSFSTVDLEIWAIWQYQWWTSVHLVIPHYCPVCVILAETWCPRLTRLSSMTCASHACLWQIMILCMECHCIYICQCLNN